MARVQQLLKARLELLKTTSSVTHIISCPFDEDGHLPGDDRKDHLRAVRGAASSYCYFPNADCPQELGQTEGQGTGWLETWMAICDNVKKTGGTVFVVYRSDGLGKFTSEMGVGTIEGQAQGGEIAYAKRVGCSLRWVAFGTPAATIAELARPRSGEDGGVLAHTFGDDVAPRTPTKFSESMMRPTGAASNGDQASRDQLINTDAFEAGTGLAARPMSWSRQPIPRDVLKLSRVWVKYIPRTASSPIWVTQCVTQDSISTDVIQHILGQARDFTNPAILLRRPEDMPHGEPVLHGEFNIRRTSFLPTGRPFFQYGELVAVERSSGEVVMGRVESNEHGRALRDWSAHDVHSWLEANGLAHGEILTALRNRTGPILLSSERLIFSQLASAADRVQLAAALDECFRFELQDPEAYLGPSTKRACGVDDDSADVGTMRSFAKRLIRSWFSG